jgi:hypothetical protein
MLVSRVWFRLSRVGRSFVADGTWRHVRRRARSRLRAPAHAFPVREVHVRRARPDPDQLARRLRSLAIGR